MFGIAVIVATSLLTGCGGADEEAVNQENGSESELVEVSEISEQEVIDAYEGDLDLLVTVDWLNENLEDVIVLDVRDEKDFKSSHIPGAINVTWQQFSDMDGKSPGDKGWGTLLGADEISEQIGNLGIDGSKTVVVYADTPNGWGEEGRVAWTLMSAGLEDIKVLNGSWNAWKESGYDTSKEVKDVEPVEVAVEGMVEDLSISTEELSENLDSIKVIDSREEAEYNGATKFGEARGGHIPGAILLTWTELLDEEGKVKSQEQIDEIMESKGINREDRIVAYCTGGIRSAHMALVLRTAGYDNAANYDASFYEWSADENLEVE